MIEEAKQREATFTGNPVQYDPVARGFVDHEKYSFAEKAKGVGGLGGQALARFFPFTEAIAQMRAGLAVTRMRWVGKCMYMVPEQEVHCGPYTFYHPPRIFIGFVNGGHTRATMDEDDMLAEDWSIFHG